MSGCLLYAAIARVGAARRRRLASLRSLRRGPGVPDRSRGAPDPMAVDTSASELVLLAASVLSLFMGPASSNSDHPFRP